MVKLASARECRQYGPSHSKKAWEYVNASLYVVATILLLVGFVLQFPDHNGKMTSIWLAIVGSIMLVIGGLFNLWKVHKVQQMESQLEKLRGGAQERLVRDREGRLPLLLEEHMRKRQSDSQVDVVNPPQPYKDVLVKS